MPYTDHFGEKYSEYLQYRPQYPKQIYDYLSNLSIMHELAWDCGTGNGQAAIKLAEDFKNVIATDVNHAQLAAAIRKENISYQCWPAEKTGIKDRSVDLITVAQALHWFNLEEFYKEVKRVSKRSAYIASWCYSLGSFNQLKIDKLILKLYADILGNAYWPKERHYIDSEYQTILFPFQKITTPNFVIEKKMNFSQLIGYLDTWSAVKQYKQQNEENPINLIFKDLQTAWGDPMHTQVMNWQIHMLAGRVE